MNGPVAWFARNSVAANLLMLILLVAGITTIPTIKKEIFPEFSAETITVTVPYPGAAPEEVSESICVKIQEQVFAIEGIKRLTSIAAEGAGTVTIEVRPGDDPRRVLDDVKSAVDQIVTFPEDAEKPIIQEITLRRQVLSVAVSGELGEHALRQVGERVRDEISNLDGISHVELTAARPYEISIEVSEADLRRHGLTFDRVANAVRRSSLDLPGGLVRSDSGEILLRTLGQVYRGTEFESLVLDVRPDGTRLLLGEVATVRDGFAETDQSVRFDGAPAVLVNVYQVGDESALEIGKLVEDYVAASRGTMPEGTTLTVWQDMSKFLVERMDTLLRNAKTGLALVFLVLALFLRFRLAVWVTIGIPISFLGTLWVMNLMGTSVNMLSLFAFILVLGIVVDDAIVVAENIFRRQREGQPGIEGAIAGVKEVSVPVIFAVLTTVTAFVPMLSLPGLTGRIWRIIPLVVIPALLFSLLESQLILPAHLSHGGKDSEDGVPRGWPGVWARFQGAFSNGLESFAIRIFGPILRVTLRHRYLTVGVAAGSVVLTIGLVASGRVKTAFFPPVEGDNVVAVLEMPLGTPSSVTRRHVERIEAAALQLRGELDRERGAGEPPVVNHLLASIGEQPFKTDQSRNGGGIGQTFTGSNLGEVNLELIPSDLRTVTAVEVSNRWRELCGTIPGAVELTFTADLFSAGAAIDIQLSGDDPSMLRTAADELKAELNGTRGVFDVTDSLRAGKRELALDIRPEAEALGLSLADLARQVRQAYYGEEVQRIQRGRDEVKVMVRLPAEDRRSLGGLDELLIRTPEGGEVPFAKVARVESGRGYDSIRMSDRRRVVRVQARIDAAEANASEIIGGLEADFLPGLLERHRGLGFSYEGERREQEETLSNLGTGFLLALVGMYALMAIPFRSYLQPLIVMSAVPFGLIGAVLGHVLLDLEISVLSMCGMVAVAGVVVNDSLVLVDYSNRRVRDGMSREEAAGKAGVARFRPILLTSMTTFAGLTPMILETSVQAAFLIPMAVSLAFGVLFSTLVSLVLVPAGTLILEDLARGLRSARGALGGGQGASPSARLS